jgi:hypothetical protein
VSAVPALLMLADAVVLGLEPNESSIDALLLIVLF